MYMMKQSMDIALNRISRWGSKLKRPFVQVGALINISVIANRSGYVQSVYLPAEKSVGIPEVSLDLRKRLRERGH